MNAKTLFQISDREDLRCLANRQDAARYDGCEVREDAYGNAYAVLTRSLAGEHAPASPLVAQLSDLSLLDDDVPVYVEDGNGSLLGVTDIAVEGQLVLFSTYIPRKATLPASERASLLVMNAIQGLIFCIIGLIPIMFGASQTMIEAQDLMRVEAIPGGFAANMLGYSLTGIALLLGLSGLQTLLMPKSARAEFDKRQRRGATGELFQLPLAESAIYFVITGVSEEVLFRVGTLGSMMAISCAIGIDMAVSFAIALIASSVMFAAAHAGTYSPPALVMVSFYGAALGALWMISGTIMVPIIVHASYDLLASAIARRGMRRDPVRFFSGKRPNALSTSKRSASDSENIYEIVR